MLHAVPAILQGLLPSMNDMEQLVAQAKTSDPLAQNALYTRYKQRAISVCRRITRNQELAEELADDAFLIAFRKLDQLHEPDKFGYWVTAIAARMALRHLGRQPKVSVIPLSQLEGFDIANEYNEPSLSKEELQSAIDKLPPGYRKVFTMAVVEGRHHKEIASALHIEPHSSSSQLYHARVMLRRMLGPLLCCLLVLLPVQKLDNVDSVPLHRPLHAICQEEPGTTVIPPAMSALHPDTNAFHKDISLGHDGDTLSLTITPPISNPWSHSPSAPPTKAEIARQSITIWPDEALCPASVRCLSITFAMAPSLSQQTVLQRPHALSLPSVSPTGTPNGDVSVDNWYDCRKYVIENTQLFPAEVAEALIRLSQNDALTLNNNGQIIRTEQHQPPIGWAASLHYDMDSTWAFTVGIGGEDYHSWFYTGAEGDWIEEHQRVAFVQLPIGASRNVIHAKSLSVYIAADMALHIPIALHSSGYFVLGEHKVQLSHSYDQPSLSFDAVSFTAGLKIGMRLKLVERASLFAEAGFNYTCANFGNIATFATVHPFAIASQIGLQFAL